MIFRYFHSAAEAAPAEGLGGDPAPRDDPRLPLHHRQQQGRWGGGHPAPRDDPSE